MKITIIIRISNVNLLISSLNNLLTQSISDSFEIICIDESFDDTSNITKRFKDRFYDIKLINNDENAWKTAFLSATGEYILFTDSNNLFYEYYMNNEIFEKLYDTASYYDSDILIYNINSKQISNESDKYEFIDSLVEETFSYNDLTKDQIINLTSLDCDMLFSNKFKLYESYFDDIKEKTNILRLKTLMDSNKIFILNDFNENKSYTEKLNIPDDTETGNEIWDCFNQIKSYKNRNHSQITPLDEKNFETIISIIIPVYNPLTKDILKALNSIFIQSFGFNKLEILFINDCSDYTDGIELIEQYVEKYPNIHLLHTQLNSGSGITRNLGIDNANGKYIMFLDHDDYYFENACELLYNNITEYQADMVSGNFFYVKEEGITNGWTIADSDDYITIARTIDEKSRILKIMPSLWVKIFNKKFLDDNHLRFPNNKVGQDKVFVNKFLFSESKVVFVDEPILLYQKRRPSIYDKGSQTLDFTLNKLLTVNDGFCEVYELYKKYALKYSHIILNDTKYLTDYVLLNTNLKFEEFKVFVDQSAYFYNDFLENKNTYRYPELKKIMTFISEYDYLNAFKEYKILKEKDLININNPNLPKISIIIDVYNKDILEIGLNKLFNLITYDIEIICVKKCNDNIQDVIDLFKEKFYNIKILHETKDKRFEFYNKIIETNGDYIFFTDLNRILSTELSENCLNEILIRNINKKYEITLIIKNNDLNESIIHETEQKIENNTRLNSLKNEDYDDLLNFDYDKLISNNLIKKILNYKIKKLYHTPLTYLELLSRSSDIHLSKDFIQKYKKLEKLKIDDYQQVNRNNEIKYEKELYLENKDNDKNVDHEMILSNPFLSTTNDDIIKISIIIPVSDPSYDEIQFLINCLLNQTIGFNYLEIIFVVNQKANDIGINLIKEYTLKYSNIKLSIIDYKTENSFNTGISNSNGKYIMFLDSKHYYQNNSCKLLYDTAREENAEVVSGNYLSGKINISNLNCNEQYMNQYKIVSDSIDEKINFINIDPTIWDKIFNKKFLDENKIRFQDFEDSENTLFFTKFLLFNSKTVLINNNITNYEKDEKKTDDLNFDDLIKIEDTFNEKYELFNDLSPENIHIVLNDINFIINTLLNSFLTYNEFKTFASNISEYLLMYNTYPNIKYNPEYMNLCESIGTQEYLNAYREYIKLKNHVQN